MIQLSNISPDFDDLVSQLETVLQTTDAWKDRITSSTGQTIVEMIAAIGAYSQFSIESAYQESWPETAKNAASQYAAANFMGVRFNRKAPGFVRVSLTAPSTMTIGALSQFSGAGTYWFNRVPLTLGTTPTEVTLYQGRIVTTQIYGLGTDFQAFVSAEKDFTVSDTDVYVTVNGLSIATIQEGLWTRQALDGAQHFTLPSGQMILLFGNDVYGTKPTTNDFCEITYAVTLGADGDNVPTLNKTFTLDTNANVFGKGVNQSAFGASQSSPLIYKNITPALFGSFDAAVTGNQYKKLPLQYPGVLDALTFAQREINPRALAWMNVIKVCILSDPVWNNTQWNNFEDWFYNKTMYAPRIFREDPTPNDLDIDIEIYCTNRANLGQVKLKVENALNELLQPQPGIIGFDVYRSDIIRKAMNADSNIEYVKLNEPLTDIPLSSFNVAAPVISNQGTGTIDIGIYDYAVSAVSTLGGESAPAFWSTYSLTANNRTLRVNWDPIPNAASYKVWGRVTPTTLGLIGTTSASTTFFDDDGTVTPTGTIPVQSTVATYYPRIDDLTVTAFYSNRDKIDLG